MKALYPGTFDPPTNGHFDIIKRANTLFDKVIVGVADNISKTHLFNQDERLDLLQQEIGHLEHVNIDLVQGLIVDYCKIHNIDVILRGVRSVADYEYELQMAIANRNISGGALETILMLPSIQHSFISSNLVRQAAQFGGDISDFVPVHVQAALQRKYGL